MTPPMVEIHRNGTTVEICDAQGARSAGAAVGLRLLGGAGGGGGGDAGGIAEGDGLWGVVPPALVQDPARPALVLRTPPDHDGPRGGAGLPVGQHLSGG